MNWSPFLWQALLIGATPFTLAAEKGKARKSKPSKTKPAVRRAKPAPKPARKPAPAKRKPVRAAKPAAAKPLKRAAPTPAKLVAPKPATPAPPAPKLEPAPKPVAPTGRAILLAPEGGKFADSVHPRFRWLSVGGATRYQIEWSDKPDFADCHTLTSLATEAAVPVEQPLELGVTYFWRVRGGNESGWGPWSNAGSFRVLEATE